MADVERPITLGVSTSPGKGPGVYMKTSGPGSGGALLYPSTWEA